MKRIRVHIQISAINFIHGRKHERETKIDGHFSFSIHHQCSRVFFFLRCAFANAVVFIIIHLDDCMRCGSKELDKWLFCFNVISWKELFPSARFVTQLRSFINRLAVSFSRWVDVNERLSALLFKNTEHDGACYASRFKCVHENRL